MKAASVDAAFFVLMDLLKATSGAEAPLCFNSLTRR
jgi:hypothetical protein